ncbi:hypothetical protein GCM10011335_41890 [Aureimonas glaciei]|uniref:Insecticide toxin TcdB middle/N-terminal domain-containing protein n=1 Tax=Aureimonas glaciei TaxID=1776957 RepID=A0A916Y8Q9_9HYPH|nr:hypothetical protein GCM10011335_41890 [Aureimonas glaciei]
MEGKNTFSEGGLELSLADHHGSSHPVAIKIDCFDESGTPPLEIDARAYGEGSRLLNVTRRENDPCASYAVTSAEVARELIDGRKITDSMPTAIAVEAHHSGERRSDSTGNPSVFVFNPVHGNWTEAKAHSQAARNPQKAYATLAEHHQRLIVGVIALPPRLQQPALNTPSSVTGPISQVNASDGYLAIDPIEPDSKGAYGVKLPMLLRPSRGPGPSFSISYNSQGAPGVLGRGWDLSVSTIEVRGPAPIYHPEYETEDYVLDGMDLIALDGDGVDMAPLHKGGPIVRRVKEVRYFRPRNNSSPLIVRRFGNAPSGYYWEVWNPNSHVTRLYGGAFQGDGVRPKIDDNRNGHLLATAKFSGGLKRAVVGQWGLTQEFDNQAARSGASYIYHQNDGESGGDGRACIDEVAAGNCRAALRLKEVRYNQTFNTSYRPKQADGAVDSRGETVVAFDWRPRGERLENTDDTPRDTSRDNTDGRLGFLRAHQYWLKGIDVRYRPDTGKLWLASSDEGHADGKVVFSRHSFELSEGDNACMNYDVVLTKYKVDGNRNFDGLAASQEQEFSFNYDGEKYVSNTSGACAREWSDATPVAELGSLPEDATGTIGFPTGLLKNLGFDRQVRRSLLGTGRSEEVGASAYVGIGPTGDTNIKPITGGFKGGYNFTRSETNSTLVDVTGDGIDDVVWRENGQLSYCGGKRYPAPHFVTYPTTRCGRVEGIADLSLSSTSTFSAGAEASFYGSVFAGVGFNRSNNDTYIYFTHRDADGLIDLAAYGQVYYGQGETVVGGTLKNGMLEGGTRVVRFQPNSALTPPLPGGPRVAEISHHLPRDLRETILEIEARLEATALQLEALDYSQTTLAWEAPLDGVVRLADGEFVSGKAEPNKIPLNGLDPEFGPDKFQELYEEVEAYKRYAYDCTAWPEKEFCHRRYSDPYGAQFNRPADEFSFVRTFGARLRVSLSKRETKTVVTCKEEILPAEGAFQLAEQDVDHACRRPGGNASHIDVRTGDVLYLTYSIHPHFAKWLKPNAVVSYVAVDNDPAFAIAVQEDKKGIVGRLPCRWNLPTVAPAPIKDCALSQLSPYTFDLRAGALTTAPNRSVELAPGRQRTFEGAFNIPVSLTSTYKVYFDVLAGRIPQPAGAGAVAGQAPGPVPVQALGRVYRFDVSAACLGATKTCAVTLPSACEAASPLKNECDLFVAAEQSHFAVATRIVVQHDVRGAEIEARNVDGLLKDMVWTRPPHIRTILAKLDPLPVGDLAPGAYKERYSLVYMPVAMGQEDIEYFRVERGLFDNPDIDMNEGDPQPKLIQFSAMMELERATVEFARVRQTRELCRFAGELLDYLRRSYAPQAPPFADEYLAYWIKAQSEYETPCAEADAAYGKATFTGGTGPNLSVTDRLNLPVLLRSLSYEDRMSSAETLLKRVQDSLSLGGHFLTDGHRVTRRGYRLPIKVNPLDCDLLGKTDTPLSDPIVDYPGRPVPDCAYRLSANFAMEDFEQLIGEKEAKNLRKMLAPLSNSTAAAFKVDLAATINGRPAAFRELTGDATGNDPCTPVTPKTCIGTYGTTGDSNTGVKAYLHPEGTGIASGPNPNDPTAGDVLQRVSTNKRTGRAVAFSNSIMSTTLPPKCERAYPLFKTGWQMEAKQDCLFQGSDISTDDEKYKGPPAYTVTYEITQGNRFIGRNRVVEFRAMPLDVVEFQIRIVPVEQSINLPSSPQATARGAFSILQGTEANGLIRERHLIPRSPSDILPDPSVTGAVNPRVKHACPNAPVPPAMGAPLPSWHRPLPATCRPWSRLGWAELLLGAQYRTYSDAQKTGLPNQYSIKRRREILRLQPEIETSSDQYLLQRTGGGNAMLVSEIVRKETGDIVALRKEIGTAELPYQVEVAQPTDYLIFHRREPKVTKTGSAWILMGNRAPRDGSLKPIPPFWQLRFGTQENRDPSERPTDAYQKSAQQCPADASADPDFKNCEAYLAPKGQISLALDGVDYFTLQHRFVGPVDGGPIAGRKPDAEKDAEAAERVGVGQCSTPRPNATASCWKGPDDTLFVEEPIVLGRPIEARRREMHSVSALIGFEQPPLAQFRFEFDSYTRMACIDPAIEPIKEELEKLTPAIEMCQIRGYAAASESPAQLLYPNRPNPPAAKRTVPVYAPVQSSKVRSVSRNTGVLLFNKNGSNSIREHTTAYLDVNGDGYADVVSGGHAELSSPVGLSRRDWWHYFRVDDNMPSLAPELVADGMQQNAKSSSRGEGVGLTPSTFAVFKQLGTQTTHSGSPDPVLDPGFSLDEEKGQDDLFTELRDFNGDGLPDSITGGKVGDNLTLALNAGGGMTAAPNAARIIVGDTGVSAQPFNSNSSAGFGVRLGFSVESGSYGAGMGLAHRGTGSVGAFMDFTGDGRPDIAVPTKNEGSGNLVVFPNLGNGFGKGRWHTIKDRSPTRTGFTETTLVDAGGFFSYGFNLPPPVFLKVQFNVSGKFTRGQTRELQSFRDMNGDGFPDLALVRGTSSALDDIGDKEPFESEVHYNPEARYHLLTSVTNPSGSRYLLGHGLYGNTDAAHGSAVWALNEVAVDDGFEPSQQKAKPMAADGHDVALTRYNYQRGYFNRAERQFYGFESRVSTTMGCDLARAPTCLDHFKGGDQPTETELTEIGYRKLQIVRDTYWNRDYLTQGMLRTQQVEGFETQDNAPAASDAEVVSARRYGYTIANLDHYKSVPDPADWAAPSPKESNLISGSWDSSTRVLGSKLPQTWDGSVFQVDNPILGAASVCGDALGTTCVRALEDDVLRKGFAREQQAFWAQQSGAVHQRLERLEVFGGNVTPTTAALGTTARLRSAVAFDYDQWGQVHRFHDFGEAAQDWMAGDDASVNASLTYAVRQGLNAPKPQDWVRDSSNSGDHAPANAGYPLLGLPLEIRIFGGGIPRRGGGTSPLRVRQASYTADGRGNLSDVCAFPTDGLDIPPELCASYAKTLHGHLRDGYSTLQTALRSTYENIPGLPKGADEFDAVIHHQLAGYDEFGNLTHAISPHTNGRDWTERRFSYSADPFRRTPTTVALSRCVEDTAGAGNDTKGVSGADDRCTFGLDALPEPMRRTSVTHHSTARIDAHSGATAETTDVNGNAILLDFDRWGRLRLVARGWGNAPRENRTFSPQLKLALAKSDAVTQEPGELNSADEWRILALADYEKVANGLLRGNLRRFDPSDSYAGLQGRGKTTRETALFTDGNGRPIQSIREADVCAGVPDDLVYGRKNATSKGKLAAPTDGLAERCTGVAKAIVTPSSAIDALGRDLLSFEPYPYANPFQEQRSGPYREPELQELAAAPAEPTWLSRSTYDGAGRPTLVESRLALEDGVAKDRVRGAAQYRYRVLPPAGSTRLARFEALTVSPRCSASAAWSDARGLTRTVFEQQARLYPQPVISGEVEAPDIDTVGDKPADYKRNHALSWGDCEPIAAVATPLRPQMEMAAAAEWPHETEIASPQPARVSYDYDQLQQLKEVSYPLTEQARASITARYDSIGRMTELHEPNSGCTSYGYDPMNLLVSVRGFRYEPDGKPCGTTSRVTNEKRYRYAADRLVEMSYHSLEEQGGADDRRDTVRFFHDSYPHAEASGELLEALRYVPNDDANRRFVDVTGRECDNCIGQVAIVADRTGARSLAYNPLGLVSREIRSIVAPLKDAGLTHSNGRGEDYLPEVSFHEIENSYTAFGDLVQQRFAESAPSNPHQTCVENGVETCLARFTIGRRYAPDGAVAELLFNKRPLVTAAQDALGRPTIRWTADGTATGYSYDDKDLRLNQLATLSGAELSAGEGRAAGPLAVQVNGYQYDGGGNVLSYKNLALAGEGYRSGFGFQYDAVNRLIGFASKTFKGGEGLKSSGIYEYDAGHRFTRRQLSILGTGAQLTSLVREWTYQYENEPGATPLHAPKLIRFQANDVGRDTTFAYDDIGRMTRVGMAKSKSDAKPSASLLSNRAMSWDAEGRLVRVRGVQDKSAEGNEAWMREDYVYDSGGNRTLRIHRPRVDASGQPVKDEEAATTATIYLTPFYARTLDRRGSVQIAQGTLPSASLDAPGDGSEAPVVTYVHSDLAVGSMTASVTAYGEPWDAQAIVIGRREYSPYGLELTADGLAETGRPGAAPLSVFHGKELDRVTNFSSFGARSYSRDLGIWLSPDPLMTGYIGNPSGLTALGVRTMNAYAFAGHNPIRASDSDGRVIDTILDVGFVAYDIGALAYDEYKTGGANRSENLTALGADIGGVLIPFATGGGVAVRGGLKIGDNAAGVIGRNIDNMASTARKGDSIAPSHLTRGKISEGQVLENLTLRENRIGHSTSVARTVPDADFADDLGRELFEIKDVNRLSLTKQIRSQIELVESGKFDGLTIVLPNRTKISGPVRERLGDIPSLIIRSDSLMKTPMKIN